MTSLVLTLLVLAQSEPTGPRVEFVERNTVGVTAESSQRVRAGLTAMARKAGLRAIISREGCASSECLKELSESKKVSLVGVTTVKSRRGMTLDLEAVYGHRVLLLQTFVTSSESLESSAEAQKFIKELSAKLAASVPAEDPTPPADAPRVEVKPTVPLPAETTPAWAEEQPTRSSAPGVVVGVSAGAVALGAGLLIAGLVASATLERELSSQAVVTTLTRPQAQARADVANGLMSAGSITAGLGAAGLVTGLIWLGSNEQPQRDAR